METAGNWFPGGSLLHIPQVENFSSWGFGLWGDSISIVLFWKIFGRIDICKEKWALAQFLLTWPKTQLIKTSCKVLSSLCIHFLFLSEIQDDHAPLQKKRDLVFNSIVNRHKKHIFCRKPSNNYLSHVYFQLCQWCERTIF